MVSSVSRREASVVESAEIDETPRKTKGRRREDIFERDSDLMWCLAAVEISTNSSNWSCRLDSEWRTCFDWDSLRRYLLEIEIDASNPRSGRACYPSLTVRRLDRRIVDVFVSSSSMATTYWCPRSNQPCLHLVVAWMSMRLAVSVDCHSAKGSCSLEIHPTANETVECTREWPLLKKKKKKSDSNSAALIDQCRGRIALLATWMFLFTWVVLWEM